MGKSFGHYKQVKHYDEPGHLHELTFSCYRRLPLLTNDLWRKIFGQRLHKARRLHGYRLVAFVFMPEHVHLIVYPEPDASDVEHLLKAIKRPFSYRIKKLLEEQRSSLLKKLTVRQRPGVKTFRFWQEGPGYDRNLTESQTILKAIDYVHENPVRRGLCRQAADWRWSSARQYMLDKSLDEPDVPAIDRLPGEFFM